MGIVGGGVAFFVWDDMRSVRCLEEGGGGKREVVVHALHVDKE